MKTLKYSIIIFILTILQIEITQLFWPKYAAPNLLLIFCILISFRYGGMYGMLAGFFLGIINDLISFQILGVSSLGMIVVGLMSGHLKGQIFIENPFFQIFAVLLNCFLFNIVLYALSRYCLDSTFRISYSMIVISFLIAPIFFKAFKDDERIID